METWDAIRARRNVRDYADRSIPRDALDRILEAARRTPSVKNMQMWDFVAVTERSRLQELAHVWVNAGHVAVSAATVALVVPIPAHEMQRDWIQYDIGQATMAIMIAAADLCIGSCHSAVLDQDLARKLLGYPEDRMCAYLVSLGYPKDGPLEPTDALDRRPFDDVVHFDRW